MQNKTTDTGQIYIEELGKSYPITDSIRKALTRENYDFYALPLRVKLWMLDPMNVGIYNKEGQIIDSADDDWEVSQCDNCVRSCADEHRFEHTQDADSSLDARIGDIVSVQFPFEENAQTHTFEKQSASQRYKSRPAVVVGITSEGNAIVSEVQVSMVTSNLNDMNYNEQYCYILGTCYVDFGLLECPSSVICYKIAKLHRNSEYIKKGHLLDADIAGIMRRYKSALNANKIIDCGNAGPSPVNVP